MPHASEFTSDYFENVYRNYQRQNPARKIDFYNRVIEPHLPVSKRPRILEIGCGFGSLLASLSGKAQTFGMDISEFAVGKARERVKGGSFFVGSGMEIPLKSSFDMIVSMDVLEHLEDPTQTMEFVRNALTPEGTFVFVVPVWDGPFGWLVHLLDRDPTHIQKKARRDWLNWVEQKFRVEECYGLFRYLLPGGPYLHFPSKHTRAIAPAILVVAKPRK